MMIFVLIIGFLATTVGAQENDILSFPNGFKIGVSTSAYQVEGAWNVSDKGVNFWDYLTHEYPSRFLNRGNGDVACDSYHKYKEDLATLKDLGVDFYRMTLSWSRILPTGFANQVSVDGIQYYKNVLDDLNALGIEPLVTISHWDHPLVLEQMGGWANEMMVTWFVDYARVVFRELGDRVKMFLTVNEPVTICKDIYGMMDLGEMYPKIAPYLCVHNMLKAHAKAYKVYHTEFRESQGGQVGIILSCDYQYPKYLNDTETPEVEYAFNCGWVANPVLSDEGDYPAVMKQRIAENSKLEGFPRSRLPEFTQMEIYDIKDAFDFVGLNHYTSVLTESAPKTNNTMWFKDKGVITSQHPSWPHTGSSWLRVVPRGFGDILRKIKTLYNNPPVYVLENGMSDSSLIYNDTQRIKYLHDYLKELLIAVNQDGCNVKGYATWSLMDNFEWFEGYTKHFGLMRTPKLSYSWFQQILRSRKLSPNVTRTEV